MIEEAYEAAHEMQKEIPDYQSLKEELGDVLFQVFLNAQIAEDDRKFDLEAVVDGINSKIKRRHPHVFGSSEEKSHREDLDYIHAQWLRIKEKESGPVQDGHLSKYEKPGLPPLEKAHRIGKDCSKIAFDWDSADLVLNKLEEELSELKEAMSLKRLDAEVMDEMGDMFFTLVQLCRHLGVDPDEVAELGNQKFLKRFNKMESLAGKRGLKLGSAEAGKLDQLWQAAKADKNV